MCRNLILFVVAVLLVGSVSAASWWCGSQDKTQELEAAIEQAHRQEMVAGVLGCVYATDSDLFRFLHNPTTATLGKAAWRIERCEEILDIVGVATTNEDLGLIFGEAKLFLNGYKQTLWELITKKLEAADGQMSEEEFRAAEKMLLQETHQFIARLEGLLYLGVQHVP